ncbi:MAG TPA: DUF2510 domain-containing protein [Nocardioides sp.]|nr:DUF2510 domain-containing protein [Nocardioides sp.]
MSFNHPAAPMSVRASRPATATAGAVIALVLTGLVTLACVLGLIAVAATPHDPDPQGRRDAGVLFGLLLPLTMVGIAAAVMALRNSNAWRITTVVLGFVVGAVSALASIGAFVSNDRGSVAGGCVLLVWAALAIGSSVLLLVNGANTFYSSPKPTATVYAVPSTVTPALPPAGWYPVDGARLRWWNGTEWSEHFHDGHSHDGHFHNGHSHDGHSDDGQ